LGPAGFPLRLGFGLPPGIEAMQPIAHQQRNRQGDAQAQQKHPRYNQRLPPPVHCDDETPSAQLLIYHFLGAESIGQSPHFGDGVFRRMSRHYQVLA
jgi:hypothetical protein